VPRGEAARRLVATAAVRIDRVVERLRELPGVSTATLVVTRYSEAGGGVLAGGLAFAFLFAIMPALLLISSLAAFLLGNPSMRDRILAALAEQFPPLAPVLDASLAAAVSAAPAVSLVSLLVLLWSASGLVRALDVALGLIFREQTVGGGPLRLVILVLAAGAAALGVTFVVVAVSVSGPVGDLVGIGIATRFAAIATLICLLMVTYRYLPRTRPGWSSAVLPGVVAGLAIAVLMAGFAMLSPLLLGSTKVFGALAVTFLGIVWLGLATDAFLLGAAWVAVRADDERGESVAP
jgi:membrane protein